MRKPSIFSKDYDKYMKRRRKKIRISIVMGVLFLVCGVIYLRYDFNNIAASIMNLGVRAKASEDVVEENLITSPEGDKSIDDIGVVDTEEVSESKYVYEDLVLGEAEITVMIKVHNEEVVIEDVITNDNVNFVDISMDKSKALIIDSKQNLFVVDSEKNISNLTYNEYTSTKGTVFKKDNVLEKYDGYNWHAQAKFVDNNNIVYVTNVPYFGNDLDQYIAVVSIDDNNHKTQWNLKGKEIKIENLQEKGLELILDGNVIYMTTNYEVVK